MRNGVSHTPPAWLQAFDSEVAQVFFSDPTLEPSVVPDNEATVRTVLSDLSISHPRDIDPGEVDRIFQNEGKAKKTAFSFALAAAFSSDPTTVVIPPHIAGIFHFLFDDLLNFEGASRASAATPDEKYAASTDE